MSKINILTYGRLGKEFNEFANNLKGVSCTFVDNQALKEEIKNYSIIAGLSLPVEADISHVKWIHAFSAGVDSWVNRGDLNSRVLITRTMGRMGIKMGEYCLAYLLYLIKAIEPTAKNQKAQKWEQQSLPNLFDQKVLILGTGGIGEGIARVLKPLVSSIVGINSSGHAADNFDQVLKLDQLPDDLHKYSVVINALPLTAATKNLVDARFLGRFEEAIYFNVGRGDTTKTPDLLEAIKKGNIRKAVLDVFEKEPLPEDSELWDHPDIIITPHQSAVTDIEDVKMSFQKAMEAYHTGADNKLVVNREKEY